MPSLIEDVARHVAGIRYAEMPTEDVASIRRLVLDTLGCAVGAAHCGPARELSGWLRQPAGPQDMATLIGDGRVCSLDSAILFNGALVRYLDFMDVYWSRDICHPSENIPVALAAAEAAHCDGRQLIEAIAAAYEVQIRLANAFSLQDMHMHHVSAAGFVAPLVLGKLWKLPVEQLAHACALGGFRHLTLAALVEGQLSMAKAVGYALPASECVLTTRLAAQGFTGPLEALEGLWRSGRAQHAPSLRDALDLSAGTAQASKVSLKQFPVQFGLQAPIEAVLKLRHELGDAAKEITALQVDVPEKICRSTADPAKFRPENRETADHSLPCCVAMAWLDSRLDAHQFETGRWRDPDVLDLMQQVRVAPAPDLEERWPQGRPARVTLHLRNGSVHTHTALVGIPLGDARRPMSDADVERKFLALAEPILGPTRADQVIKMVAALDELPDVGALCRILAPPGMDR
ncbi:MmgE/PrpD family protein [Bordetella tumulicola]|uniref:MmgE/PrpD family protein n=1 Tax=Bordetella tumulicola TaxID=1649133 RepID=UPI0039F13A64